LLGEGLAHTPFNLTEARVLYELAQRGSAESADLRAHLGLDAGYLSRILGRFEEAGIVAREKAETDARRQIVSLTDAGRAAFEVLDERTALSIPRPLSPVGARQERGRGRDGPSARCSARGACGRSSLREPVPAISGWVVARHGALYAEEYGWDVRSRRSWPASSRTSAGHDPHRERVWIATIDGAPGRECVLHPQDDHTGELRLCSWSPSTRRRGRWQARAGLHRVRDGAGYTPLALWTNDVLHAARRIYEREGFELVEEAPHQNSARGSSARLGQAAALGVALGGTGASSRRPSAWMRTDPVAACTGPWLGQASPEPRRLVVGERPLELGAGVHHDRRV
jgi:DNA-binding MarR family transcriptional regulator